MSLFLELILFSLLSGSTVFVGAVISFVFEKFVPLGLFKKELIHTFIAFGAGIMLAAVSFVLIPQAVEVLTIVQTIIFFTLGSICFYFISEYIKKKKTKVSQLMAMLLDFIPESISLGSMFLINHSFAILLAVFIALQNLPEAFNSYLELRKFKTSIFKTLLILFCLSFVGLIFSLLGYIFLKSSPSITAAIMIFSSGGILYLIFEDIAPSFRLKENSLAVLGVNFGFIVGLLCHLLV